MDSTFTQTTLARSTDIEATFNDIPQTAADFKTFESLARILPLPNAEKQSDEPRIGAGAAGAFPTFQRSRVLQPQAIDISDIVNVDEFPVLLNQHMGKPELLADIAIVEATKAWKHFLYLRNYDLLGRQKPSRSFIVRNNGADFVYGGGVSGTMNVAQTGIDDPRFTFGFVTSGLYLRIGAIGGFGALTAPTRDVLKDMLGNETVLSYNDGVVRNLNGRWKSFSFSSNNNIDTGDLRAGMSRVNNSACPTRGWYRGFLNAGDESVACEFRVAHDDLLREWDAAQLDTPLTQFEMLMKGGCIPTSAANNQYSTKISIGKCYFRDVRGGEDNNLAINDVTVFPVRNGSYFGMWRAEVVNGSSAIIDPSFT